LAIRPRVDLSELPAEGAPDLGIRPWERPGQVDRMVARVSELRDGGARFVLIAEGRGSLDRAKEVLGGTGLPLGETPAIEADVEEGFWFEPEGSAHPLAAVVTEEDLFGRRRHTRTVPRLARRRSEGVAVELAPGD